MRMMTLMMDDVLLFCSLQDYVNEFLSVSKVVKLVIFLLTFNFISFAWVQHTILLRRVRVASRLVTVMTIVAALAPCILPMAATAAMDGVVAQWQATQDYPGQQVNASVISTSIMGLGLPFSLLYFSLSLLACKFVFAAKMGKAALHALPDTLSTGFLVFAAIINLLLVLGYFICNALGFNQ
jgi:hypothetical protein